MSMIHGTNVVVIGGTFNNNDPQTATEFILRAFGDNYVSSATHDNNDILDPPKCHPGTRTSLLVRLSNWVEDKKSEIYLTWLHGPAGAGKSAIARSLAENLDRNHLLAGSFFFFRSDSGRNSERPFVMTLAYQISRSIPNTLPHIAKAVQDDPTVIHKSLKTQFEKLIIEPLVQITTDESESLQPMLIIIDGLDECIDQQARNLILQVVFDAHRYVQGYIKFFVVSRPEYDIHRSFDSAAATLRPRIQTIGLQEDLQAYEDVRNYLNDNFHRIKQVHPLQEHFPPNWPSDDAIERLVEKSSGHFIYASTIIKYIENDFDQPQERLDIIVNLRATSQNPYAALDALYLNILTSSRTGRALLVNILSIVVLDVEIKFSTFLGQELDTLKLVRFIESVLFLRPGAVQLALLDLKSLVGVEEAVQFWHQSFSDFLLDSSRSKEFCASPPSAYTSVAKHCLRLLQDTTGLLERSWSTVTRYYPTAALKYHHLLSVCCKGAVVDLDLQTAMMKYKFNVIPPSPHINPLRHYFWVLCSCLCNYQQASIFEGRIVEHLLHQFDHYLISELRCFAPLDSVVKDVLRATISPLRIDWNTYRELAGKNMSQMLNYNSCFFRYMYFEDDLNGEAILCEFFYTKDRACEYYLGESPPELPSLKRKSSPGRPDSSPSLERLKKQRLH